MVSSILTNNGAMTALQSLKSTQKNLLETQNRISTGLKVSTAKDNAATWAVATSMRSDIANFKQVSENLSVSAGVVKTASTGTEQIASLISKIRESVTSVQDGVKDTATVQAAIKEYVGQIDSIISSSAFKGVNLINNSREGGEKILASVNANGDQMEPSYINVARQNLTMEAGGALEGLSRLTVERAKDNYSYAPATGVVVGDKVSFTFKINGVEKTASFTAASASAPDLMKGLKDAINTVAGSGNAFADIDVNGKLVVNADLAADVVSFDGKTAMKATGTLTLGAATDNAPQAPKYAYGLNVDPAVGNVYSFSFKVGEEDKVATYTAKTGEDKAAVLKGLKNVINQVAGTGNEVASIDPNTGKLVVDSALGKDKITFDGNTALSTVNAAPAAGVLTANAAQRVVYDVPTGVADAGDTLSLTLKIGSGSATAITSAALTANETMASANGKLATAINAAGAGEIASVDATGKLVIDTTKATQPVLFGSGSSATPAAGDVTVTLSGSGSLVAGTGAPADTAYSSYSYAATNNVNDVISFTISAGNVAEVTVAADDTQDTLMAKLANAINAKAGSNIAMLDGSAAGSKKLLVLGSATAGASISVQTHAENVASTEKQTPASSTDYKDLLARLKTVETSVLAAGAAFGAAQTRIDLQKDFMDKLVDTLTSGVGALVDADMSEEAARLQALQVQEQLGTQALSIANQAPQSILSLFRG